MVPFWQGLFEGLPSELPYSIEGDTWRAVMVRLDEQEAAFPAEALELLAQGKGMVLATVVHSTPDAPCKTGAKLLVEPNGTVYGRFDDSALQEQAVQMAAEALDFGMPRLLNTECVTVLLEPVNL